jgi:hypothetical protein
LATDVPFAFEATVFFFPVLDLACFETVDLTGLEAGFATAPALKPTGSAVALPLMNRQAMQASNGRLFAQKRLIGRRPVPVLRSCSD